MGLRDKCKPKDVNAKLLSQGCQSSQIRSPNIRYSHLQCRCYTFKLSSITILFVFLHQIQYAKASILQIFSNNFHNMDQPSRSTKGKELAPPVPPSVQEVIY